MSSTLPTILSIRSLYHNVSLRESLASLPVELCEVPLLYYQDHKIDFRRLKRYSTLIVTSKYAASLIAKKYLFDAQCMVVGDTSAAILSHNPHLTVKGVFNNVKDLQSSLAKMDSNRCLHLAADVLTQGLQGNAEYRILYRTIYRDIIDNSALEILNSKIDYVFLYSENSAKQFISICKRYDLLRQFHKSVVITISDKVQKVVEAYMPHVIAAAEPSSAAMVNILRAELCL